MPLTHLVTGANRGIGLEFARQLRARGDTVLGTARDPDRAADLRALGVEVLALDVTDDASLASFPDRLRDRPVDVLINNAGVSSETKSIGSMDASALERVFRVNSIAPLMVTKAALPALGAAAGGRRLVVNITSQLGSIANNTGGSSYGYRASKAALNMLTVSAANELRPEGFTVVAVHPGWVRTDMGGSNATLSPEESVAAMIRLLDRLQPSDSGRFLNYDGSPLPW